MHRVLLLLLVASCGSAPPGGGAQPPDGANPARPAGIQSVEAAAVFDSAGNEKACATPEADCPAVEVDRGFIDECRLAGYRDQKCGCEVLCTGRVGQGHFDAEGQRRPCPPAGEDCSPPNASAAFQDACTERGHRLVACGCEAWLCSGDPTR